MSFMAGFGQGFSQSWSQAQQAHDKRSEDLFKRTFDEYTTRRDEYEKAKGEDTKIRRQAHQLAEETGQPPEAWARIYEMLATGRSVSDVQKTLSEGKFSVTQRGGEAVVSEQPVRPGPMASPGANVANMTPDIRQEVKQEQSSESNFLGRFRDQIRGNMRDKVLQRVGSSVGASPDEIREGLSRRYSPDPVDTSNISFTRNNTDDIIKDPREAAVTLTMARRAYESNPSEEHRRRFDIAQAQYDALVDHETLFKGIESSAETRAKGSLSPIVWGKYRDENGTMRPITGLFEQGRWINQDTGEEIPNFQRMSEPEEKILTEVYPRMGNEIKDFNQRNLMAQNSLDTIGDLFSVVDRNQNVLQGWTAGAAQRLQAAGMEISAAYDLISGEGAEQLQNTRIKDITAEQMARYREQVEALERDAQSGTISEINRLALDRAILDAKMDLFVFEYAQVLGQEGRALSNLKREIVSRALSSGVDPERFKQNLSEIVYTDFRNLDREAREFQNHPELQQLRAFEWDTSLFDFESPIERMRVHGDQKLRATFDEIERRWTQSHGGTPDQGQPQQAQPPQSGGPVRVQSIDEAMQLPPGTEFIDPRGVRRVRP